MREAGRLSKRLLTLLLFCVLTALLGHTLIGATLRGEIPGWRGDNIFYLRHVWWMKHALVDLHVSPVFDPTSYYPTGQNLVRSDMSPANMIPAVPVTMLGGPVLAYNVLVLFSFVATGFATCLWVERLTGRLAAGLVAGTIAAFLPFRFAQLPGHLPQLTTQWIPLTFYAFEGLLARPSTRRALGLGVAMALVVLSSWYYGYALALLLPLYALARSRDRLGLWATAGWWRALLTSSAVAVLLVTPFALPMLQLSAGGGLRRSLGEMQAFAINVYDPLLPNLVHPLWGEAASRLFPWQRAGWVERGHALGYVALLLGAFGAWRWRRRERAVTGALVAVWIASYAIALGPFLVAGDRLVRVPLPRPLVQRLAAFVPEVERTSGIFASLESEGVPVPLPSAFLYEFVPFTRGQRVMARFSIWTGLMTAALAGFGIVSAAEAARRRFGDRAAHVLPALAIALVVFESASHVTTTTLPTRAVDEWLARQPEDVVIVELPVVVDRLALQNYWATLNGRRSLLGWGASFPEAAERERRHAVAAFPSPATIDYLKASATTYVLVTPARVPQWPEIQPLLEAEKSLALVETIDGVRVYRVVR